MPLSDGSSEPFGVGSGVGALGAASWQLYLALRYLMSVRRRVPLAEYFRNLLATLQARDVFATLAKGFVFGLLASTVATFQGFKVKVAVTEIPRAVIKAVGQGFVLVFVADAIITLITYV